MPSRPLDSTVQPNGKDPGAGSLSEQALADLERRRNLLAAEMSRLSAALDDALSSAKALHADEQWETAAGAPGRPAPPPAAQAAGLAAAARVVDADVTQQLPRLRRGDGGSPWAPTGGTGAAPGAAGRTAAGLGTPAVGAPAGDAGRKNAAAGSASAGSALGRSAAARPAAAGSGPGGSAKGGSVAVGSVSAPGGASEARQDARPGRVGAVLAAVGVAAVVLLAVLFVLQRGRGIDETANTGNLDVAAVSEAPRTVSPSAAASEPIAAAVAPSPPAPSPVDPSPLPTSSPALDAVLVAAATAPQGLPVETQALVARVPGLQLLTGPSRAEEAADIYGLAVIAARGEDTPGPATLLVDALEPEVTFDALAVLAQRRPAAVGVGVAPLLPNFASLATVPADEQRAQAQSLLDAMIAGVEAGTVSRGFCNVGAQVLEPYLPAT